jgi:pimeloyl-ACP methyl ester carboxylesterase
MAKQILFIQDGSAGAHDDWDSKLVANLRRALGQGYDIRYPRMPNEADPSYPAWKTALEHEIAALDNAAILVGHSVGGTILINALAEQAPERKLAGVFLVSAPFVGPGGWPSEDISRSGIWAHDCRGQCLSISIMAAKMALPPSRTPISINRPFHRRTWASPRAATTN